MNASANTIFGAMIGSKQQAEFEQLRKDWLMNDIARVLISKGWNSTKLRERMVYKSFDFCEQWTNQYGRPIPSMIGLPAAALISIMQEIETVS